MQINPITSMGQSTAATPDTTGSGDADTAASEQSMFMSLLVAQLKNQDPLDPQDGTAFVAQLAQFNSLDQLVGIRDSIDQLSTLLQQKQTTS